MHTPYLKILFWRKIPNFHKHYCFLIFPVSVVVLSINYLPVHKHGDILDFLNFMWLSLTKLIFLVPQNPTPNSICLSPGLLINFFMAALLFHPSLNLELLLNFGKFLKSVIFSAILIPYLTLIVSDNHR